MSLLLTAPCGLCVVVTLLALGLPLFWLWRITVALATTVTAAQHLHLLGNDLSGETLLTVLACPFAGAQAMD